MCGSGTFLIEAGLLAVRRAPNVHRNFGIEHWPSLGREAKSTLDRLRAEARANSDGRRSPSTGSINPRRPSRQRGPT